MCLAEQVRIADSHFSRLVGLMGTRAEHFPGGQALLIAPCRGIHSFFMRFAIDALYLDNTGRVVHCESNLKPWRMAPLKWRAAFVLELPAGTVARSGTELGDHVELVNDAFPVAAS